MGRPAVILDPLATSLRRRAGVLPLSSPLADMITWPLAGGCQSGRRMEGRRRPDGRFELHLSGTVGLG